MIQKYLLQNIKTVHRTKNKFFSTAVKTVPSLDGRRVKLEGTVQRVVYRSPDNLFSILSVKPTDRDTIDVSVLGKGAIMGLLLEGQTLSIEGTLKTHKKYGMQLEVTENDAAVKYTSQSTMQKYQDMEQNVESMRGYLKNGFIPQVGPATADLLVNHFGDETAKALLSTTKLMKVNGIGKVKAQTIAEHWKRDTDGGIRPAIMYLLSEFNLSFSQAKTLLKRYGVAAPDLVKSNPYRLIDDIHGVGFLRADEIARRMGIPIDSDERLQSSIVHWLAQSASTHGHTCLTVDQVCAGSTSLLSITNNETIYSPQRNDLIKSIEQLEKSNRIVIDHGDKIYTSAMYEAETLLATSLSRIVVGRNQYEQNEMTNLDTFVEKEGIDPKNENKNKNKNNVGDGVSEDVNAMSPMSEEMLFNLSTEQQQAVLLSRSEQLLVLTGGPGTGKTFTTRSILREWYSMGNVKNIVLTSPTARAARHLGRIATEGLPEGIPKPQSMTIHKLLEYSRHKNKFVRDSQHPLEYDAVVVDECSMLDTQLAASLFSAMRPGTRVLIVGDSDQLPSVGPGNVLRDLVNSDTLPVVRLEQIYRQEEAGGIVQSAHHMNRGDLPMSSGSMISIQPNQLREEILNMETTTNATNATNATNSINNTSSGFSSLSSSDCVWVEESDSNQGASLICNEIMNYIEKRGFSLVNDVQVLSPMHKGNVGTLSLNKKLRSRLNPKAQNKGRNDLDVGDRVMQETNDYDLHVWNGECGTVVQVGTGKHKGGVTVEFTEGSNKDDVSIRSVKFSKKQSYSLALSYACTIHKSQGQEFPVVVVPAYTEHYHMLSRELVYTALTRASQLVIFVGQKRAFSGALRHQSAFNRSTGLLRHLVPKERVSEDTWRDNNRSMNGIINTVAIEDSGKMVDLWNDLDLEDMVVLDNSNVKFEGGWERGDEDDNGDDKDFKEDNDEEDEDEDEGNVEVEVEVEQKQENSSTNLYGPWTFESSKKKEVLYTTKWNDAQTELLCDCPGYTFRRSCKHVKEIQEMKYK